MKALIWLVKFVFYICIIWGLGFGFYYFQIPQPKDVQTLETSDAIAVLTGGQNRLETGLDLLEANIAPKMLISGVHPQVKATELASLTGRKIKQFLCCITLGFDAINTIGNAHEIKAWRQAQQIKNIYIVTSDYHMPRAMLWMKKVDPEGHYRPFTAVSDASLSYFVEEYNKYLITLVQNGESKKETNEI